MKCICGKQPAFALPGKRAECCKKCKKDDMIDVKNKKCSCGKQPAFALPGKRPTCCKECKTSEMVNVKNKKCSCGKQPVYGILGNRPTCCKICKTSEMVNIIDKKCQCGKISVYSIAGNRPICCKECKTSEMVNVKDRICSCGKQPVYGFQNEQPVCCLECKKDGMMNVKSKRCPCNKQPSYGFPGERPTCCTACQITGMIGVYHKTCPGYNDTPCPVMTYLQNNKLYCLACDPDDSRRKLRKVDEEAFFKFLDTNGICTTQREFRIDYSCIDTDRKYSLIDGIIITKDIVICLEVDEEAHAHYDPTCEEARLNNATTELRLKYPKHYISWVRINPNTLNKDGKRDRTSKGRKVCNERHHEALSIIKELMKEPNDCIKYIGY